MFRSGIHLILFFATLLATSARGATKLCDNIFLEEGDITLNGNEKILICGTNKGEEGWADVPLTQAELHLRAILQSAGYSNPHFERNGNSLKVWSGSKNEIKDLKVNVEKDILNPDKKRNIVGENLTSGHLDEVTAWANSEIRSKGYACPNIKVTAQTWDGNVLVNAHTGLQGKISRFDVDNLGDLNMDVMDRYQPFSIGDIYDIRKTQIMSERLLNDGLFQSAFFETTCKDRDINLNLQTSIGRPKILRFGIGASTEETGFIDLTFRNAHLDNMASSVTTTLHISNRLLSFVADSELYWFPGWHTVFFGPRFRTERESEPSYQTDSARVGADIGRRWDMWNTRFLARWGPTLNIVNTVRGLGPEDARYPTIDGSLSMMSHNYEAYRRLQYEGWTADVFFRGQGKGLGSQVNVNRYESEFKYLWNIGQYAPPLFVLGTRLQGIAVDAEEVTDDSDITLIPVTERIFVGGDQNLRGFPRLSIDNQRRGFLSFLMAGFELRLIEELPYNIQPFLLWDAGQVGNRRYTLDPPKFISEGGGIRWLSPFGTFRGTAARGRVLNQDETNISYPEQWVFFLSFGQEF
jgi:outer membrane protein assembly factor BamA